MNNNLPITTRSTRRASNARRGVAVVYMALVLFILLAIIALAVDVGRMRLARAELQTMADAAARAGASGLPFANSDTGVKEALDRAVDLAGENQCLGKTVKFDQINDIQVGQWFPDSKTFVELPNNRVQEANAIRTNGVLAKNRGNGVSLLFAPAEQDSKGNAQFLVNDIRTAAIAYIIKGPRNFAVVGLDRISANGNNATIRSYIYPNVGVWRDNASIGSNGDIDLNNSDVYGDVRAGPDAGDEIDQGPNSEIAGWMAPLDEPLDDDDYPPVKNPGSSATSINPPENSQEDSGKDWVWSSSNELTLNGSGHTFEAPRKFLISKDDLDATKIIVTGYVALYVDGDVNLRGSSITSTSDNDPRRLQVNVIGKHSIDIGGNATQRMVLYAPQSNVKIHGGVEYYGSIIAGSVDLMGTADIYYPESLATDTTSFLIKLVK